MNLQQQFHIVVHLSSSYCNISLTIKISIIKKILKWKNMNLENSPRSVVLRSNITNVIASVDGRVTGLKPPGTTGSGKFSMSGC